MQLKIFLRSKVEAIKPRWRVEKGVSIAATILVSQCVAFPGRWKQQFGPVLEKVRTGSDSSGRLLSKQKQNKHLRNGLLNISWHLSEIIVLKYRTKRW